MQKYLQCPTCGQTEIHTDGQPPIVIKPGDDNCLTPVESWKEIPPPARSSQDMRGA